MSWLLTQYGIELEIDTTPFAASRNYVPVCDGFDNIAKANNEQVQEFFFLCGKGWGSTEVTGARPVMTLTGFRKIGDPAQDFIFGQQGKFLNGRKTTLRRSIMNADGTIQRETLNVTIQNIQDVGGATTEGAAISVEFAQNGPAIIETLAATGTLTLASVAGATAGTTVLTVTPTFPDAGCKFVYAVGDTAPTAAQGTVLTGWNDFVNGATYEIASGKYVTVAMVNIATYVVISSDDVVVVAAA